MNRRGARYRFEFQTNAEALAWGLVSPFTLPVRTSTMLRERREENADTTQSKAVSLRSELLCVNVYVRMFRCGLWRGPFSFFA